LLLAPAVQVGVGSTLQLAGAEHIGSLNLAGTVSGTSTLNVDGSVALLAGNVGAPVSAHDLTSSGSSTIGAPARDLTADDIAASGYDADALVASGLYARPLIDQPAPEIQPTKPARKGKGA
jgi:hypothetical protein